MKGRTLVSVAIAAALSAFTLGAVAHDRDDEDSFRPADPALVKVELRHPFKTEPRTLNYRLVKTPDGWRIHDIVRPGNWSLVSLLSRKP